MEISEELRRGKNLINIANQNSTKIRINKEKIKKRD